jgi:hypothetical protein
MFRPLAESELGVLSSQCLDRRIPDKQTLVEEVAPGRRTAIPITPRPIGTQPQTLASNSNTSTRQSDWIGRPAEMAKVSPATVVRFEASGAGVLDRTVDAIRAALEAAGVEFTNGDQPGVKLGKR